MRIDHKRAEVKNVKKDFMVESYGISDVGLVRSNNEDVWAELPDLRFFALADGMGGHKAGEVAAAETVKRLCSLISELSKKSADTEERAKKLKEAIEQVNKEVYLLSLKNEQYAGMGTTLVCFQQVSDQLIIAHVGDSRIYRFRKKTLTQLTKDHSLRQELLFKGDLSAASPFFAFKNIVTRAMGTHSQVQPEVDILQIQPDDIYFLCSDGLTDELSFEKIKSIVTGAKTIKEASDNLVAAAKAHGGSDNITIVMVKVLTPK
jgi:protein phosphatase